MTQEDIRALQRLLAATGHDPGPVDGRWGPRTRGALLAAERAAAAPDPTPEPPQEHGGRRWSQRSLDNLRGVHPDLVRVMDRALVISPLDFVVIEGLRTVERQRQLVAAGASRTMDSRHLTGHAVDLLPIGPDGKAAFDWPLYHLLAPAVKAAAAELGIPIVWGGDWVSFRDGPHFELSRAAYP